jgi:hydrogenase 3 maturation protease
MNKKQVLTIGNGMMGDDAAGPLLARRIRQAPLEGWEMLNGGSAPENCLFQIREMAPYRVLIVDAADMGLAPGEVRLIDEQRISDLFLMTTHSLPLTFLMRSIREFVPQVSLVGIQPENVSFGYPVSSKVKQAVELVYLQLKQQDWAWESLGNESDNSPEDHLE